ncbi:MAG: hypothetical protein ACE5E0_05785 [Terriglobia bacterium]
MKLRAFALFLLLTLALGLLAAPVPAEAQRAERVYRVGMLQSAFRSPIFTSSLGPFGEGENITFQRRTAIGTDEKLPELAAELVRPNVDVIVASGVPAIRAAKNATKTMSIGFPCFRFARRAWPCHS